MMRNFTQCRHRAASPTEIRRATTRAAIRLALLASTISCLLASLAADIAADDADWKLRPLPYNNPGLVVDLGVGLWAYPMPLDYDGDGDLDLLVGCPDKPSQGAYYFENTSQNAKTKMPVFEPGVHIGDGYHYMLLSRVGDEPVVLRPGLEYRRDSATGQFDFNNPRKIDAPQDPHSGAGGRTRGNMWRYVDYDGDGDHDLAVGVGDWTELGWDHAYDRRGRWRNGPLHGYVYLLFNEGSDERPDYGEPARLHAGGGEIDVYGWPCPNFVDFDRDGDLDLICGEFLDGFTYFQNIGSRTSPQYSAGLRLETADRGPLVMHLQMITPTAVDWDSDGDIDLVVGDEDGRVAFVENTGRLRNQMPVFESPKYFQQRADTLKFGALATPVAYDWDRDGDQDLLCGNTAGSIGLFENLGLAENGLPKWAAPQRLQTRTGDGNLRPFRVMAGPNGSVQGPCEAKWGYTTLSAADWDGDGDGDILYNSILARVGLLLNEHGTLVEADFDTGQRESPPAWDWRQTKSSTALTQWRTTPAAIDFDRDGQLDLVMLDQQGYLTLRRGGKTAERIFLDEYGNPLRLNAGTCGRSGRVKLCVVDWDGDSRLDVLVNSENATWYRNCKNRGQSIVLKRVGNLASRNVAGHTSSPAVCDFDGDDRPDLLVGSENGRIYHIHRDDCIQFTAQQLAANPPRGNAPPRLPGLVKEEFVFQERPFDECRASTICQTTRGLVAAWSGVTEEAHDDVGVWTSYHDGLNWSTPTLSAHGVQHSDLRYPCWNPVLYQPPGDAPTLLFCKVGPDPRSWWGELLVSYDRGRTFVGRRRLPEGVVGPARCKPILLSGDATLLCGSSTEHGGWRVHFESVRLADGEPNGPWRRLGPVSEGRRFNAAQPTFLTHIDGKLQILCLSQQGNVATSFSTDRGRSWSPLQAAHLRRPSSGIDAATLSDGRHLILYNYLEGDETGSGGRELLAIAVSHDGMRWRQAGVLERAPQDEFSYPGVIQSSEGLVHATYTWKRRRIKHVVLDPADLVAGEQID